MPGYLARTISILGPHSGSPASGSFSGREFIVFLVFVALFVAFLGAPLLGEALFNLFSAAAARVGPGTFLLGVGVLLVGLIGGIRILDLVGAGLIGAVLLGVIVINYLAPPLRMPTVH